LTSQLINLPVLPFLHFIKDGGVKGSKAFKKVAEGVCYNFHGKMIKGSWYKANSFRDTRQYPKEVLFCLFAARPMLTNG